MAEAPIPPAAAHTVHCTNDLPIRQGATGCDIDCAAGHEDLAVGAVRSRCYS